MKVTINEVSSTKRGMEVELPPEVVDSEMDRAYETYRRSVRLPGFRKGRIPLSLVKQRFGKQVEGEVLTHLIEEYARRALDERKIRPIHEPVLDEYDYREGHPFVFRTTFEVRPEVPGLEYRGITVSRKDRKVGDADVDASLEDLRERAAKYATVEGRKAENADVVVGTLAGRFLEGKGKDFTGEPITMRVGSEDNHPDFNAALAGIGAGESRSFRVAYPEDYPSGMLAGRVVEYELTAREIKVKSLPALDDELAKEIGSFSSLAELREHVRGELERRAREAERAEAKDKILTALVERHDFEVPGSLVESELDRFVEETVRRMILRGIDPQKAEVNWKEEREKGREFAVRRVKAMLILEAIAERESIAASAEDVNASLQREARRQGISVADLKDRLARKGALDGLESQITREKALDFLLDQATIRPEA